MPCISISSGAEAGAPTTIASSGAKIKVQSVADATFADVMGVDGAKLELEEVVQVISSWNHHRPEPYTLFQP